MRIGRTQFANRAKKRFGWLEFGLLLSALALVYQFLPEQYNSRELSISISKWWSSIPWDRYAQALDVRQWSLTARVFLNFVVVMGLVSYRYKPNWKTIVSKLRFKRTTTKRSDAVSETEKQRQVLLEHYKKRHEIEKARNR